MLQDEPEFTVDPDFEEAAPFALGSQVRVEKETLNIHSAIRDGFFEQRVITAISPNGDVLTTRSHNSFARNGEVIHDPRTQLIGQCQVCGEYTTRRTTIECANPNCRLVLCQEHSRYHSVEQAYFCLCCYKRVRIKRLLLFLAWLVIAPFVEKVEP